MASPQKVHPEVYAATGDASTLLKQDNSPWVNLGPSRVVFYFPVPTVIRSIVVKNYGSGFVRCLVSRVPSSGQMPSKLDMLRRTEGVQRDDLQVLLPGTQIMSLEHSLQNNVMKSTAVKTFRTFSRFAAAEAWSFLVLECCPFVDNAARPTGLTWVQVFGVQSDVHVRAMETQKTEESQGTTAMDTSGGLQQPDSAVTQSSQSTQPLSLSLSLDLEHKQSVTLDDSHGVLPPPLSFGPDSESQTGGSSSPLDRSPRLDSDMSIPSSVADRSSSPRCMPSLAAVAAGSTSSPHFPLRLPSVSERGLPKPGDVFVADSADPDAAPLCTQHRVPCIVRTVRKPEHPAYGRRFFSCAAREPCDYTIWKDAEPEAKGGLLNVEGDLFSSSDTLVHCVSQDMRLGKGIAKRFRDLYDGIDELVAQKKGVGEVAYLRDRKSAGSACHHDRYIVNLITKEQYWQKPTYDTVAQSLKALRQFCRQHHVTAVSMPRIGCGLDGLEWGKMQELIKTELSDLRVTVYTLPGSS